MTISKFPKHFSREELLFSAAAVRLGIANNPENERIEENLLKTANFLEYLRSLIAEKLGSERQIKVLSCYRSPKLNKAVGGSKTSAHMNALAADIIVPGMSVTELAKFIATNVPHFDQLIVEFGQWVHIGIATNNACRNEILTAKKIDGQTKYLEGIVS